MRRFKAVLAAMIATAAMLMFATGPAQAYNNDYLNQSRLMLQSSQVFVSGAVNGISDGDIAAAKQTLAGTNVALVVLPAMAASDLSDTAALATQLANDTNYTVGVQAGALFAVGSRTLSADLASQIGATAGSQGSLADKATTLVKMANMQPAPPTNQSQQPQAEAKGSSHGGLIVILVVVVVVGGGVAFWFMRKNKTKETTATPQQKLDAFESWASLRFRDVQRIEHETMRNDFETGNKSVLRLVDYIRKSNSSDDDIDHFIRGNTRRIEAQSTVVERCILIEQSPAADFSTGVSELEEAANSAAAYAAVMQEEIRQFNSNRAQFYADCAQLTM